MRGVIATFDAFAGVGLFEVRKGSSTHLREAIFMRRSKEPLVAARVVFRLKQGAISRAVVVREKDQCGWVVADFFLQVLLYLPIP